MQTTLQLEGLDCAVCASELEEQIKNMQGVSTASVSFATQKLVVEYDLEETLDRVIYTANHFEDVKVVVGSEKQEKMVNGELFSKRKAEKNVKKQFFLIGLSAIFFIIAGVLQKVLKTQPYLTISYVAFAVSYVAVAYPILKNTVKSLLKGKIFNENFLMTVASIGAILIGEIAEGVAVMLLYQLGETLQAVAVGSSRRSIADLMNLKSEFATLLKNGEQTIISAKEVQKGDILLVKAGEKIPVDGCLLSATATLDTKALTGESHLKKSKVGGQLLSGMINAGEVLKMQALRVYEDSASQKILQLIENATISKAKTEKFITKFAKYYTPIVCLLAVVIAAIIPFFDGLIQTGSFTFYEGMRWVRSALTFLVVSCPCALVVSVPLSYFSGIGACAKNGVLIKGATYLDVLARAKQIAFDKTGTLTEGNFTVLQTHQKADVNEDEILQITAAVERHSSHPIAKAFSSVRTTYKATNTLEKAGFGLQAEIGGSKVFVGSHGWLLQNGINCEELHSVNTLVYVAKDGNCIGVIELGDKLRKESLQAIEKLKNLGFQRMIMLTGDREEKANAIGKTLGLNEISATLLPDEKLQKAKEYIRQGELIYVGDGINDAPVMTIANCAVSMGKLGSAAAVEASDVVLIEDDLSALATGITYAKKTRKIVMQNIVFSIAMKVAFMALGLIGVLPLSLAVFADVGVMLLAVLNALRIKMIRKEKNK